MSSARAKGTTFESAVRDRLKKWFPFCERAPLWGCHDKGDLLGIPGFVIQCRNTQKINLAGAIDDARKQAGNNGGGIPVAIVKRRGVHVGRAYVVMELDDWAQVIA